MNLIGLVLTNCLCFVLISGADCLSEGSFK